MLGGLFGQPKKFVQIPGGLHPFDLLSMVVELLARALAHGPVFRAAVYDSFSHDHSLVHCVY